MEIWIAIIGVVLFVVFHEILSQGVGKIWDFLEDCLGEERTFLLVMVLGIGVFATATICSTNIWKEWGFGVISGIIFIAGMLWWWLAEIRPKNRFYAAIVVMLLLISALSLIVLGIAT